MSKRKLIATVCHESVALIKAADSNPSPLKGKRVTGYSNAEEALATKNDTIPFTLEDWLTETEANCQKLTVLFIVYTAVDGLLILG